MYAIMVLGVIGGGPGALNVILTHSATQERKFCFGADHCIWYLDNFIDVLTPVALKDVRRLYHDKQSAYCVSNL